MRIRRRPKHVVRALEREHRDRDVSLHVRDRARIAQQSHKHRVLLLDADPRGETNTGVEARDGDFVFQADGHAREWPLQVAGLCGRLGFEQHDFGEAVGRGVRD